MCKNIERSTRSFLKIKKHKTFSSNHKNKDELPFVDSRPQLSNDLLHEIFLFLANDTGSIARIRLTCKLFNTISLSETLWKEIYSNEFPDYYTPTSNYQTTFCALQHYFRKKYVAPAKYWRIGLVGKYDVGKECFLQRITSNLFVDEYYACIQDEYRKCLRWKGKQVVFEFPIFNSEDQFSKSNLKNCDGFMLCCAINDRQSMYDLETDIETIYTEKKTNLLPIYLIVMKGDLEHKITRQEIRQFVEKHKLDGYYITSAKLNHNCDTAYLRMVSLTIYKSEKLEIGTLGKNECGSKKCCIS